MQVPEIDVDELERRLPSGVPLIDVREPDEYAEVRLAGSVLIPLALLPERAGEIPRDREVLVICARGGRSRSAAAHLRTLGVDAVNVAGGTLGWLEAGKPVLRGPATGS